MMSLISCVFCITFILIHCTTIEAATNADAILRKGKLNFGSLVYDILSQDQGNLLFSPLSIHEILSLLYYGAAGSTKTTLKSKLGVPEANGTATAYKSLIGHLKMRKKVTFEMANKIYATHTVKLVNKFKTNAQRYFDSDIEVVNFGQAQAATNRINKWIAKRTHNKIKTIIPPEEPLPASTRIVLLNAVYFNGEWFDKFDLVPKKQKFFTSETDMTDCSMMTYNSSFEYKIDVEKGFQFVRLPYVDKTFSLTIILPNDKAGFADLEKKFVFDPSFFDLRGQSKFAEVTLPRFKIEKEITFNSILRQIELEEIFNKLDIPKIVESRGDNLVVSDVRQKVFIDVNENGTIAAGASGMRISTKSLNSGDPDVYFTANHPFLFLLEALVGNVRHVLFQGRVLKPEYH